MGDHFQFAQSQRQVALGQEVDVGGIKVGPLFVWKRAGGRYDEDAFPPSYFSYWTGTFDLGDVELGVGFDKEWSPVR
jgi:hypothetical protein